MFKEKISIVGAGQVGSTIAYTLVLSGLASDIVLVDINQEKAEGDAMDMNHGLAFVSPVKVTAGDYSATQDSDLVILTAGANQKPGESRLDLLRRNTAIFKSILDALLPYCKPEVLLLVVTNPVDILTYVTRKLSGLSSRQVIGSGTVLDTARLKYLMGEHARVDARNIHAYVIGEHGDSELAAWSTASVAGMRMEEYCRVCNLCDGDTRLCKADFDQQVRNAAYEIIQKRARPIMPLPLLCAELSSVS